MSSKSHVGFWVIAFLVSIFVVPLLVRADVMRARLVYEVEQVRVVLGDAAGQSVVRAATSVYDALVVDTGLREMLDSFQHTDQERKTARQIGSAVLEAAAGEADGYFQSLSMQLYSVILRATIVLTWLLMLLPFGAAVLLDGFYTRAKKFETLGFQNPTAFAMGMHAAVLIAAVPLMYIVAPLALSPMFFPWWAAAAAIPLSFAIQHMQPVITR